MVKLHCHSHHPTTRRAQFSFFLKKEFDVAVVWEYYQSEPFISSEIYWVGRFIYRQSTIIIIVIIIIILIIVVVVVVHSITE